MATTGIRRRQRGRLQTELSPTALFVLTDGLWGSDDDPVERFHFTGDRQRMASAWRTIQAEVLAAFAEDRPGMRPQSWWDHSAPKMTAVELQRHGWLDTWFAGDLVEPRRRLGGVGTESYLVLRYVPHFNHGVPVQFVSSELASFYRAEGRPFPGVPYDPADPPRYESSAAYLRRHGLFLPGEERRLSAPDFEPEVLAG
ncbi:MAG TPA: hypothetical protein VFY29_07210 [Terriglobia bacterium]|nr:hypothetical protein [Terriglobia bacterium]